MINTAKPTPGPWKQYPVYTGEIDENYRTIEGAQCVLDNGTGFNVTGFIREVDAALMAEAGTVFHETGLTPRQLLDRLNRLQQDYSKTQHEIKQVLGKALGNYPWYKDDQKNFPSATDADGVCVGEHVAETIAEEAADVIVHLKEQRDELIGLLREFVAVTGENCRHDHHGYCQEHFLEEDCLVARTINTLAKCGKEKTND
jgi:hypothetical protein